MKNQWGTVGYYLENGHGDVVNLYTQDQTLLNTYDYDLWGNPKVTKELVSNPLAEIHYPYYKNSAEFDDFKFK
ncbi:hypothetical protein H1230_12390 [Paenibacillus sp. 19GGS1-52]|uniref:hypothetical protein n=1 Tax=Paenibacillus sp. 19GGS1-52 TaxID=2758563 RepID=UPI001EFB276B|nr:hypothetical protein [Paenibacillus sp. 19GGS1-52]ULO09498.1 hypothetical protein H1230_12390 [Paenibacillus sp. 19GGS1-52]